MDSYVVNAVRTALDSAYEALNTASPRSKLIVAVSGGADSVVLLDVVCQLRADREFTPIVAHVDHRLRSESQDEARFVEQLCEKYGVPFELYVAAPRDSTENLEAWGRRIRYDFFGKLVEKHRAMLILTAHHANDQAETVLQRFLAGRVLTDAYAIAAFDSERKICRPLLHVTRAKIEEYVREHQLEFVTDASNTDVTFNRNKIRHELLPQLEREYNPNLVATLMSFAERFGRDEAYLDAQAQTSFASLKRPVTLKSLRRVNRAVLWRVLRLLAEEHVGDAANKLGYQAYQKACDFVSSDVIAHAESDLGFGIRMQKQADSLVFVFK